MKPVVFKNVFTYCFCIAIMFAASQLIVYHIAKNEWLGLTTCDLPAQIEVKK